MKTQLLMIIAVILSSLLTISQRANAQEVSQLRWLEPTVEERLDEVIAPDQDVSSGSDSSYISFTLFVYNIPATLSSTAFVEYHSPIARKKNENVSPRAPPVSLI
jgi:hypothetical protein